MNNHNTAVMHRVGPFLHERERPLRTGFAFFAALAAVTFAALAFGADFTMRPRLAPVTSRTL